MAEAKKAEPKEEPPETVRPHVHKAAKINTEAAHKFWQLHGIATTEAQAKEKRKEHGRESKR